MWLLAHAVDGGVDMDGGFVLALFFFFVMYLVDDRMCETDYVVTQSRVALYLWPMVAHSMLAPMAALTPSSCPLSSRRR